MQTWSHRQSCSGLQHCPKTGKRTRVRGGQKHRGQAVLVRADGLSQAVDKLQSVVSEALEVLSPSSQANGSEAAVKAADSPDEVDAKSDEYSNTMNQQMGSSLEYRHEAGMNFNEVLHDIIVGSCLQQPEDVDRLADKEGVGTIFCLQEDSDMAWFDLDVAPIIERCKQRGDIQHIRYRIRDFDPFDLRIRLPGAVQIIADQVAKGHKVYIHCTAGMGRAPASALAYMTWCRGMKLKEAHWLLTSVRACNPRLVAIRQAACDLLLDAGVKQKVVLAFHRTGTARSVQIAGLDVGWGQRIDLQREPKTHRYMTERTLPVGKFPYRLVYDENIWSWSADHPLMKDGDHTNNYVEVMGSSAPEALEARARIMTEDGDFTGAERRQLERLFAEGKLRESR